MYVYNIESIMYHVSYGGDDSATKDASQSSHTGSGIENPFAWTTQQHAAKQQRFCDGLYWVYWLIVGSIEAKPSNLNV